MHTGGEPLRIVTGGYPPIPPGTILEKRAYVRDNLDHLRKLLMFEPRGHYDMYGALLVEPDLPGADLAVLFMHNEGYSTMCGHAIIALGRYAVDEGLVAAHGAGHDRQHRGAVRPGGRLGRGQGRQGRRGVVRKRAGFSVRPRPSDRPARAWQASASTSPMAAPSTRWPIAGQFGLEFGQSRVRDFVDAATALTER